MTPTKRTSFDMERKSCDPGHKLELLKQGTSQGSAAEQLDIIGFGCFAQCSRHLEDEWGPTGLIIEPLISARVFRCKSGGGREGGAGAAGRGRTRPSGADAAPERTGAGRRRTAPRGRATLQETPPAGPFLT